MVTTKKDKMNITCANCSAEKCFIRIFCSAQSLDILEQSKCITRYKKGQYIFFEGNLFHGIYIINSGKVKVLSTGFNEKMQIIRLANSGYLLGYRGFGNKYYHISAVALEDSILCFFETSHFTQLLKSDVNFTYQLMLFYANELRLAESRMKNLAQMTVKEKSAEALLLIMEIFGRKEKDRTVIDTLLSRMEMAELAGLSTGQITRCFSEFKKERIIQMDKRRIIILRPEALNRIIASYYPAQVLGDSEVQSLVL